MERYLVECYEDLGNAIIAQAATDYRRASKVLKRNSRNPEALDVKKECQDFFHSWLFSQITSVDPDWLIDQLDKEGKC